jgi:hypothetical protein
MWNLGRLAACAATAIMLLEVGGALGLSLPAFASSPSLAIDSAHLFSAPRQGTLFVLIDLWPQRARLVDLPSGDRDSVLVSMAINGAKMLAAKPGMENFYRVRVEFGYIKNLDEYARNDFSSMVRFGYVLLKKEGDTFSVAEDKLDLRQVE